MRARCAASSGPRSPSTSSTARTRPSPPRARSASGSAVSSSRSTKPEPGAAPGKLVLASASPRRRELLVALGLRFEVVEPEVEELTAGEPREVVVENARRKARAVASVVAGDSVVIGADTDVVVEGEVLGKPADEAAARTMLNRLSRRQHEVHGGLAIISGREERTAHCLTRVRFRALEPSLIDAYLAAGAWRGFAGGYAIQGVGSALVERVDGELANVIGLSVAELLRIAPDLLDAPSP